MRDLYGKRVLITGGASGIGRSMALLLAKEGAQLIIWDIHEAHLTETIEALRRVSTIAHYGYQCDITDKDQVYSVAEVVTQEVGDVSILINNAGIVSGKPLLALTDDEIERTFNVNTLALFWTAKAFLPSMVNANEGHIVTIASAAGLIGVSRLADYSASKFAARGFNEALRNELAEMAPGVKTTVVCPFYINTGMFSGVKSRFSWLLPILDQEKTARQIVAAIKTDRPRLMLPPLVLSVPLLRILPLSWFDRAAGLLGINRTMDHFEGRKT